MLILAVNVLAVQFGLLNTLALICMADTYTYTAMSTVSLQSVQLYCYNLCLPALTAAFLRSVEDAGSIGEVQHLRAGFHGMLARLAVRRAKAHGDTGSRNSLHLDIIDGVWGVRGASGACLDC